MNEDNINTKELVLQKLLLALRSMEPLIVKKELKGNGIYKNDILFCIVVENDVYFNPGKYCHLYFMDKTIKLPFRKLKNIHSILQPKVEKQDADSILQYATESYWLMSGIKKPE